MWKLPELPWDLSWVSWREGEGGESGDAVEGRNAHVPVVHVATANLGTRLFNGCEEGAVTNPMHKRSLTSSRKRGARKGRGKRGGQESGKGTSSTSGSSTRMVSHSSSAHVQLESQVGVPE